MKRITFFFFILSFLLINNSWSQDTIVIQPGPEGKDAYINDYYTTNYGDYPNMFAIAATSWGDPFTSRSLLEFDLSSIPPEAYILEAKLSLYFANNPSNPHFHCGENTAFLQRVIEPWDEYTVTWWNQPETTEQNQVRLPESQYPTQDYTDIDVQILIQDMVNDPENSHGILFRLQVEEIDRKMMFASGDNSNPLLRPKLEVTYMGCVPPTADFEYQLNDQTVSFTGISPTAITWHWDFGDGDTSNVQDPEHVYEQPGIYEVCLRVEDTCAYTEYCEVLDLCNMPPVTGFTFVIDGLDVNFQDSSIMATEYFWDFGDGYFSSLKNPWHAYDESGTYLVCLETWNDCGYDTACQVIDLCVPPVSGFTYMIEDLTVSFEDNSLMAEEYFWDFGDGYYSNLANPSHIYDEAGSYLVCLSTLNSCGSDTACELIDFNTISIPETGNGLLKVYPNPARDVVFIKTATEGQVNISLHDLSGKEVLMKNMDVNGDETIRISLGNIEPGLYLLRINSVQNQANIKLMVLH